MSVRPASAAALSLALLALGCSDENGPGPPAPTQEVGADHASKPSCKPGGDPADVAREPERDWPPPPQPSVTTEHGAGCAEPIAFCVPWVRPCAMVLPLLLPDRPVELARSDQVHVDFGAPVRRVHEQVETGEICATSIAPVDGSPQIWSLELPESVWDDDPRGCGRDGELEGSLEAVYANEGRFTGYRASFGFRLRTLD